jgi:hypothetical protein
MLRHPNFTTRIDRIGNVGAAVVVIDNFMIDPQRLIDEASGHEDFTTRSRFYPGVRSPTSQAYADALSTLLADVVRQEFGWQRGFDCVESNFSLVTTPPQALQPYQRIPHIDGVAGDTLAVLHYLCSAELGGTSFYRHRSTGYETIHAGIVQHYMETVNAEVRATGMPAARYVDGDTPLFERIARYDAVFNRALIYSGATLHSGNIAVPRALDANPRTGRLTVNTFIHHRPPEPVPAL